MHEVQHGISVLPLYDTSDLSVLHFMHGMRFFKRQKVRAEIHIFPHGFFIYSSFMKKSSVG